MTAIKHIVLFKFKATTTETQIEDAFQNLTGLKDLITGLAEFIEDPIPVQKV